MKEIKRGEIYSADFGAGFGSEQGGVRPVLILQNNTGNKHAMQTSEIGNRLTELRIERRQKLTEDEDDQRLAAIKDLTGILDEYEPTAKFDKGLFDEIVESITVDSSEQLTFKLLGDIALTEKIPKKGRCKTA